MRLSLLLFVFFRLSRSRHCSKPWIHHEDSCYLLAHKDLTQREAVHFCRSQSPKARVLRVESKQENEFLSKLPFTRAIWLGAKARFDIIDASMGHTAPGLLLKWPNDKGVKFANFVDGSSTPSASRRCVQLLRGGGWRHANCTATADVVCERSLSRKVDEGRPCVTGWRWNPSTRACYKALVEANDYDLISAETACFDEELGDSLEATLTSITSSAENNFVFQLAKEANRDVRFVLLGGYGDSKNGEKWHWIDGASFSAFTNWLPGMPHGRREAAFLVMNRKGKWINASANYRFPSSVAVPVCKYSPS